MNINHGVPGLCAEVALNEGVAGIEVRYRPEGPGVLCIEGTLAGQLKLKWAWTDVVPGLSLQTAPAGQLKINCVRTRLSQAALVGDALARQLETRPVQAGGFQGILHRVCPGEVAETDAGTGQGFPGHSLQGASWQGSRIRSRCQLRCSGAVDTLASHLKPKGRGPSVFWGALQLCHLSV